MMNPSLPVEIVDQALEEDPEKNRSEYLACWREDLSDFVPSDRRCLHRVDSARATLRRGHRYVAFTDASGGTGSDAFALAIGHRDTDGRAVLDVVRERKPRFVPALVVQQYAELLHAYQIREVTGDRFSGGWCASEFERCWMYHPSDRSKSELYLACLPMLLAGQALLLDNERLRRQFGELERRTHSGNRKSVDHRSGKNDDLANAVAGALLAATAKRPQMVIGCQDGSALFPTTDGGWERRWDDERDHLRLRYVTVDGKTGQTVKDELRVLPRDPKFVTGRR